MSESITHRWIKLFKSFIEVAKSREPRAGVKRLKLRAIARYAVFDIWVSQYRLFKSRAAITWGIFVSRHDWLLYSHVRMWIEYYLFVDIAFIWKHRNGYIFDTEERKESVNNSQKI